MSDRTSHPTTATDPDTTPTPPFLTLPIEIRQKIYAHLLTTPQPIQGNIARGSAKYSLHTAILRTSRLLHNEARPVFFSRNTFCITSLPSASDDDGSGAFEPPLQLKDLPLVRTLHIDVLFYPKVLRCLEGRKYGGWSPVCPAAERYVGSLVGVLGAVEKTLVQLKLTADTRRFSPSSQDAHVTTAEADLDARKILTGFHMLDRNPRFREALAKLALVRSIALHFVFDECCFDFCVAREVLCAQRAADLAGQVLARRNEMREVAVVGRRLDCDGDGDVDMEGAEDVRVESRRAVLECVV